MANHEAAHTTVIVKKKGKGHDDGHGGAWKVAFADFCLALLCLFLVMWLLAVRQADELEVMLKAAGGSVNILSQNHGSMDDALVGSRGSLIPREFLPSDGEVAGPRKKAGSGGMQKVSTPVSRPPQPPQPPHPSNAAEPSIPLQTPTLTKTVFETRADMKELADLLAHLSIEAGLAANVQSIITPYGLRVILHDTDKEGMFHRGSAVANPRFITLLGKLGPVFNQITNQMLVVGHTDSAQYRDQGPKGMSNWTLSSDRAVAARAYLMMGGMPARSVLQVVGLADRAPFNVHDAAAAENRRIELLILTEGQAQSISAMFGEPGKTAPLIENVSTSLPDGDALAALQGQLAKGR